MDTAAVDSITRNIFVVFLTVYKKLLKVDFERVHKGITHLHFPILRLLNEAGSVPMSEIGKRLLIPKPQMTHFVDQLAVLGMVIRVPDTQDRRVINICLTDKGRTTLTGCVKLMRENMRGKLSDLEESELAELSMLLNRLAKIGAKFK
jgi:DNA-binding MarR family transcriptional regulator